MKKTNFDRRNFLMSTGAVAAGAATIGILSKGLILPAQAKSKFEPTQTMRGGSNNYRPNAPIVENLGTGFIMSGMVRKAGTGEPLPNIRIQIWAATVLGGEPDPINHGSVLTKEDGSYALEMAQIVPNFGQPHGHLAYDDDAFKTVFLRPIMPSASDKTMNADFVLEPA